MDYELGSSDEVETGRVGARIEIFVCLCVIVDAVVTGFVPPRSEPNNPLFYAKVALATSQLGLLGAWLGFREPWPSLRRVFLCGVAVLAWFAMFAGLSFVAEDRVVGLIAAASLPATVALGLFIARTADVRLYNLRAAQSVVGAAAYQFTLRQMFVWTTLVAALISLTMLLLPVMGWLIGILIAALFLAMFTWAAIWAVLGRSVGWRLAVLCAAPGGLAFLLALLVGPPGAVVWPWAILFLLHCLLTAGSLAVFRANGYRVGRMKAEG
jgi:hypothetical protein